MVTQEVLVVEVVLVRHLLRELAAQVILRQLLLRKEITGAVAQQPVQHGPLAVVEVLLLLVELDQEQFLATGVMELSHL
jgi:hypothetical protein